MSLSYKDALLLGKAIETKVKSVPKKTYKKFSTSEIKKMCIWGRLNELKQVNPSVFTKLAIELFVKTMNDKLSEIEMWKYEDQNQYQDVLLEFDERAEGIRKCIEYVNSFIKYESDETTNDIFEICFNGNHKELCKIDINKFSIDMIENLIINKHLNILKL